MAQKEQLDLLVVNPASRRQVYQSLGSSLAAIEPPIWAGLIATYVRNHGFSVRILDAEAEDMTAEETADHIAEAEPVLTAVVVYGHQPSASTQTMPGAGALCTALKQRAPHLKTVMVGGHVASLPERTLREEDVDFVAGGEGPVTTLELLQALKAGRSSDLGKVGGLWYRDGAAILSNPIAPLVTDLDQEMPEMAWDLLPMEKYRAHNWHCFGNIPRQPYGALYTTLGCPYHCSFCCIQAPFKSGELALGYKEEVNSYRFWSPQAVIAQIDKLVNKYGVHTLRVSDEMFVLNRRHVHTICDLIIERGYDLNIWAYARVDTIRSDETVEKLKQAGFNWLCFGIESASERVLNDVQKGIDQADVYKTVEKVRQAGIYVIANYIFGLPEDDPETMQATLDQAMELNCEFANFYCGMAYPGSQLYNVAVEQGWPLPKSWSGYSQHSADSLPLPTKYLSGADVLRFRDKAFQAYFANPRFLDMIGRKFGPETVQHIREMASHQLVRINT